MLVTVKRSCDVDIFLDLWKQIKKNISIIIECVSTFDSSSCEYAITFHGVYFCFDSTVQNFFTVMCVFTKKRVNYNLISFHVFNHGYLSSAFFVRIYAKWKSQMEFYRLYFLKSVLLWSCALENRNILQITSMVFILMIHISVKFFLCFHETSSYYVWKIIQDKRSALCSLTRVLFYCECRLRVRIILRTKVYFFQV